MRHVQRFALDNIYCAPGQDRQFSFKMVRVNKSYLPAKGYTSVYGLQKHLPNKVSKFQVFLLGNLPTQILNLMSQKQLWLRDSWIKASDDMVARNLIVKVYNEDGLNFPRDHIYYSFTDENSLMIALEVSEYIKAKLPIVSFKFLQVYSNAYFQSTEFNNLTNKTGISYKCGIVNSNSDKVQFQNFVALNKAKGGDVFIYADGYYVPEVTLSIEDGSLLEVIYDQSVISRETVAVTDMRTFSSIRDSKMKYLMYRDKTQDFIQYEDDNEVYIHSNKPLVKKGLFYYKHKAHAMRNVTDKDYSFNSQYINNTCMRVSSLVDPGPGDKYLILYTRRSGRDMPLVYSSLKLHELYKLPAETQLNVINNTGFTLDLFRAERLENSDYFKVADASKMSEVTLALATSALGYGALTRYFAETPCKSVSMDILVPELYQWNSVGFEYNEDGKYVGRFVTNGPIFSKSSTSIKLVEFMKGSVPSNFGELHPPQGSTVLTDTDEEVVILAAYFEDHVRQSVWEEVTSTSGLTRADNTLSWDVELGKKVKIVRLNQLNIYEQDIDLSDGSLYFPIISYEDKGTGLQNHIADVPYLNISLYLNGNYLTQGIDYTLDFPYVSIVSKKYIDYTLPAQKLHVRASGFTLDKQAINHLDVSGFVSHGTLTRNSYYDLRNDRVYSVYVDGKLKARDSVRYSEDDNTVRLNSSSNGLPYTLRETFIPIKFLTGQDTRALYESNNNSNKKIADLFNVAYPEPSINPFNVIGQAHYLFSPVVSKIINDLVRGVLPESLYSTPYNDDSIHNLLSTRYKGLLKLDPVKLEFPSTIVEIHPHLGNTVIALNLLQYRFVINVIRIITNNKPQRINLSGYLSLAG